jgi:hypothetical protein
VVEQLLIAVGVMALVFTVAAGVAAVLVVRRARRRYRWARARIRALRAARANPAGLLPLVGSVASASIGSPGWWLAQNRRHRMWRAVTSAEHALNVARQADVALGDLPALAVRLHEAARGVDAVLRAGGRQGRLGDRDRADCDQVVAAAMDLRSAALSSLRAGSRADLETVVSAVRLEVAAVAAGARAAHG